MPDASSDPAAFPIGEAVEEFHRRDTLAMALPAHRAGRGAVTPSGAGVLGEQVFAADAGLDKGVDDRLHTGQVLERAQALFAQAVGADRTWFSTNGSTASVHVAMLAALHPGETVVMARNGHKSAFAGLVLSGAWPVYVDPEYDGEQQVAHGVEPAALDRTLTEHPEARAVLVFSPTYYGVSSDVRRLAEVAHAHDVPLLTDDAWGLDHAFCSRFPPTAIEAGADLSIGSVHKTLDALGQTSVLSVRGDRVDRGRLALALELEESTSVSTVLLASIDAARHRFATEGEQLLSDTLDRARRARKAVADIPGIDLMDADEVLARPGAAAFDPTHLTADVTGLGLTGFAAADWLTGHHGLHLELADHRRVMALITVADDDERVDRMVAALRALAEHRAGAEPLPIPAVPHPAALRMPTVTSPREAFLGPTEMVPREDAAGRVCAEMICPYPPGVPVAAPGELLSAQALDYLGNVLGAGGVVQGAADRSLARVRVVAG